VAMAAPRCIGRALLLLLLLPLLPLQKLDWFLTTDMLPDLLGRMRPRRDRKEMVLLVTIKTDAGDQTIALEVGSGSRCCLRAGAPSAACHRRCCCRCHRF